MKPSKQNRDKDSFSDSFQPHLKVRSEKQGEPGPETTGESSWQTMSKAKSDYTISSLLQAVRLRQQNPRPLHLRLSSDYREQHQSAVTQFPSSHQLSPPQAHADDLQAPMALMMSPSKDKASDAMASSV